MFFNLHPWSCGCVSLCVIVEGTAGLAAYALEARQRTVLVQDLHLAEH